MKKKLLTTALLLSFSAGALSPAFAAPEDKPMGQRGVLSKLSEKKATQYRETMKKSREGNRPLQEKIRGLEQELSTIATADKFDKKAFLAKSEEIHSLRAKARLNLDDGLATVLDQSNVEERRILAQLLPAKPRQDLKPKSSKPAAAKETKKP